MSPASSIVRRVGFFETLAGWLSPGTATSSGTNLPAPPPSNTGIRSPWAGTTLTRVVVSELFGLDTLPVTRAEAMSIPAISRGRHILVADAARCPLEVLTPEGDVAEEGAWLQSTRLQTSPQHRMVWTVDDLMHYGWSLWIVQRDSEDRITDAARCPYEWWTFSPSGEVLINEKPVPAKAVILIPGYHEGIVNMAGATIRGSRKIEEAWQARAANPIPATELHQTTPDQLLPSEVQALVDDWSAALTRTGGAVGYTPQSIEVRTHGDGSTDLLVQGRNAAAVDGARHVGVPAAMVDAGMVTSSLTYETTQGRNLEYVDRSLALYLGPIESRLSLDDVTSPGNRTRANLSAITASLPPATGHPTGD